MGSGAGICRRLALPISPVARWAVFRLGVDRLFRALQPTPQGRVVEVVIYQWVTSGDFQAAMGFLLDPLSAVMILVVTGVGLLIHIYSIGYMHGDEGFQRYFAYLNLFIFSMLLLVMGNNFLLMFLGWEGVGLCSYLLIGFWFTVRRQPMLGRRPSSSIG